MQFVVGGASACGIPVAYRFLDGRLKKFTDDYKSLIIRGFLNISKLFHIPRLHQRKCSGQGFRLHYLWAEAFVGVGKLGLWGAGLGCSLGRKKGSLILEGGFLVRIIRSRRGMGK